MKLYHVFMYFSTKTPDRFAERVFQLSLITTKLGTKRFDSEKAGDREVQRTMLELLNQLDGFQPNDDIKASFFFILLSDFDIGNKTASSIFVGKSSKF